MAQYAEEKGIAMTPYSAFAAGRLSRPPGERTKRMEEDSYAKFKYDKTEEEDAKIITRVAELSRRHGVSMTTIALAWLLTRVTAPIAGVTKLSHIDAPIEAADFKLSPDELLYLEELYVPHALSGVMAQNRPEKRGETKVWTANSPKLS
ncbi:hypothetical protein TAMA11512_01650 [Selenomonas sp. TAMA-11512]|uniref:aldo/keto reductase n=1 Tax=Selenomonas sp. TAMA-11512 TaxID=3095337 RepID=UPI00309267E4|nr:hypothetical protein TAMA11512_01650 [Selenomonas sp. TAMA-11512]